MAKPITLCHLIAATILIVFLVTCQPSSARPLNGAFPGEDGAVFLPPATEFPDRVRPCHEMEQNFRAPTRAGRKYGPLFLSMLPKGQVPPSGPSKGINGHNN